jgi:UDP-N-acetylmuramoylalanine--D-glutamate ligase
MEKFAVIGFGISGRSAAAFLLKQGSKVLVFDKKAEDLKRDSQSAFFFSDDLEDRFQMVSDEAEISLEGISLVILSPGISLHHPIVQKALQLGIEVVGEPEFAFRHLKNRCVGITGTNGKTTTVLLVAHILNQAGKKARALGNVGVSLTSYLLHPDSEEILVAELSSYQLETLNVRCLEAAAILNLTPNHLDRYSSMDDYAAAKIRIQNCLIGQGKLFVSLQAAQDYGCLLRSERVVFDGDLRGEEEFFPPKVLENSIQLGLPEKQNILAALALCSYLGVSRNLFQRGLETFRKPSHRIEWVAEIEGVSYYNDSKSSNIESVMHAMSLFNGPLILIAGGVDKGSSYHPWIAAFGKKVKKMIAYGEASRKMEQELGGSFSFSRRDTLQEAVACARAEAGEKDVVLLSPGCSSFDQFRNYEHRGEEFKRLVKEKEVP